MEGRKEAKESGKGINGVPFGELQRSFMSAAIRQM